MQSGITASSSLHTAFQTFLTSPSSFALLITITSEKLEPLTTIPFSSSSSSSSATNQNNNNNNNLPDLPTHLPSNTPIYIIIRRPSSTPSPAPQLIAITYVPPTSPVRQKTLFASTRLSLVRELGSERFSEQIFATEVGEVVEAASADNRADGGGDGGVLTEGEKVLEDVKRKEEEEMAGGGMGMGGRRLVQAGGGGGVGGHGMKVVMGDGVAEELGRLGKGERGEAAGRGRCVMLKINADESIALAGVADTDAANLASVISDTEPRYSFFGYPQDTTGGGQETGSVNVVFIYTCPSGSRIKERMVYASMRRVVLEMASRDGGFVVARKIEASSPSEITAELVAEEVDEMKPEVKQGFARPKRPGKR